MAGVEDYDFIYKFVLVGKTDTGKTNVCSLFTTGQLPQEQASTIGVEFSTKTIPVIPGSLAKLQIWDTAEKERYRAIATSHYRRAVGAMIVYDVTKLETFDAVPGFIQELREKAEPDVVIMLVGNKVDLCKENPEARRVSKEMAEMIGNQLGVTLIEETSAVTGENVIEAFQKLAYSNIHIAVFQTRKAHVPARSSHPQLMQFEERKTTPVDTTPVAKRGLFAYLRAIGKNLYEALKKLAESTAHIEYQTQVPAESSLPQPAQSEESKAAPIDITSVAEHNLFAYLEAMPDRIRINGEEKRKQLTPETLSPEVLEAANRQFAFRERQLKKEVKHLRAAFDAERSKQHAELPENLSLFLQSVVHRPITEIDFFNPPNDRNDLDEDEDYLPFVYTQYEAPAYECECEKCRSLKGFVQDCRQAAR